MAVAARRGHSALAAVGREIGRRVAWAAFAVLVLTTGCSGLVSRGEPAAVREAAPGFTLPAHDGRTVSLSDLLARGPALVVFYRGHWWQHCRRQLGQLAEIQNELAAEGIGVAAISVDLAPESQLFARRLGIEFPLLSDPQATIAEAYGVVMLGEEMAIPSTFVVRQDGTIAWRHVGETVPDRPAVDVVREQARAAKRR